MAEQSGRSSTPEASLHPLAADSSTPAWRVPAGGLSLPAATYPLNHSSVRRRQLLRGGFWAGVAVLAAGGLASAAEFISPYVAPPQFGSIITVPAEKVPRPGDAPYHDLSTRIWLVNLKPGEGVPPEFRDFGAASHAGGLLALYQKCTHMGCTVPWRPDFSFGDTTGWFRCPCHAQTYTKAGIRVFGPSPRSMDTFPIVEVTWRGVTVNTGRVVFGSTDDPQRTVPAGPFG